MAEHSGLVRGESRADDVQIGVAHHYAQSSLDLLQRATASAESALSLPKCVLLFAHPDDETLALGARLKRFRSALLVHVTDGAPRAGGDAYSHGLTVDEYRAARFRELTAALQQAGLSQMRRDSFGIPDQETSRDLNGLTQRVEALLETERPEVVFTHPYEGGHPDHDATVFATHQAVRRLQLRGEPVPVVVEAAFYHVGHAGIETGCFLESNATFTCRPSEAAELSYELSPEEQQFKAALLHCFATQAATLQYFALHHERFRLAPEYDFSRPPHAGPAFYDRFGWSITSAQFCTLASKALATNKQALSSLGPGTSCL